MFRQTIKNTEKGERRKNNVLRLKLIVLYN